VYVCEDTHTSYFPPYRGGLKTPGTFHEYVKGLIDDMHAWYYAPLKELSAAAYLAKNLFSIAVFDSIVVMEKRHRDPPFAVTRGSEGFVSIPASMSYLDMRHMLKVPDA
jgi:hypothetical protein